LLAFRPAPRLKTLDHGADILRVLFT
jgi:hypothetical protein